MMNATAAMIGGVNCPPLEAAASTPPANELGKPCRFIMGIVNTPVPTTLAVGLPEMVPNRALATMAEWAGPPRMRAVAATAILSSTVLAPVPSSSAPKMMKITTSEATMPTGNPNTPS